MFANVAAYDASIALDGVLIEKMGTMGVEMIVGAKNDPEWGPVVLAGFGGVTAEILKDVKLFTPDLGVEQVKEGLLRLKQAPLLTGWRGAPGAGCGCAGGADRADRPDDDGQPRNPRDRSQSGDYPSGRSRA